MGVIRIKNLTKIKESRKDKEIIKFLNYNV